MNEGLGNNHSPPGWKPGANERLSELTMGNVVAAVLTGPLLSLAPGFTQGIWFVARLTLLLTPDKSKATFILRWSRGGGRWRV